MSSPTIFNSSAADDVLASMQIFPTTNTWNEDISKLSLRSDSATILSQVATDLKTKNKVAPQPEMN